MSRGWILKVAALACFTACAGTLAPRSIGIFSGAPVVLISIDTLRADHLPAYGYTAGSTPTLDRLAHDGTVFDDVYSQCPLTLPSHASLLTGRLPFHHGVRDNIGYSLGKDERTLAARFRGAGYATGGAISAFVLRHQTGIASGFDFYDDALEIAGSGESLSDTQRDGRLTVDALAGWIDTQTDRPIFAFLHLYEPHTPYTPPPSHAMAQPYDGEIAYADELVDRLLKRLDARRLLDKAIVAVVSDHGEGLGDHGEAEHGIFLYREALRVPWILRLPNGTAAGVRVAGPVGLIDVAPTLLELAGLQTDGVDGESRVAAIGSGRAKENTIYSESLYPRLHFGWSDLAAATSGKYRYVQAPTPELYDVSADPGEKRNVASNNAPTVAALSGFLTNIARTTSVAAPAPEAAKTRERLRSLGYLSSSAAPPTPGAALADPKARIGEYEALREAQALEAKGQDNEAIAVLEPLVARDAAMVDAWELLARSFVRVGRMKDAIAAFGKVLAADPLKPETHLALARIFALDRQAARARQEAELAIERDPAGGHEMLAELMLDQGRLAEAAANARRSIDADASRYMSHFVLGIVAQQQNRCAEAVDAFGRAIVAKKNEPHAVVRNLHAGLGDCLARLGRTADAEREFQAELSDIPWSPEGRVGLATLYRSEGRDADVRPVLEGVVTALPEPNPDAYWTVVHAFTVLGDSKAAAEWRTRARSAFPSDARFK